jgi:HK97 family phage portal protein
MERKGLVVLPGASFWLEGAHADGEADAVISAKRAYAAAVICYACIRYRVQKLVESPLYVWTEDENGDREWVKGHPLGALLEEPNPDQDMVDLLEETQLYLDLDGMALWLKTRDRLNRVAELRAFSRQEFTVTRGADAEGRTRLYAQFRVALHGGSRTFGPEDVVLFRYPNPEDRHGAISPTEVALSMLRIGTELRNRVRWALRNAAMPSGVFSTQGDAPLTDEQFERARAELKANHVGALNTGRPMLIERATWQRMGLSLDEMRMGDLWREVEATTCMAFAVRPELIGATVGLENSPWSHIQTAKRMGWEDCIAPIQSRYTRALTRQLLRPVDPDTSRIITFDNSKIAALQEDAERQARIGRIASDVLTDDERRAMLGREPLTPEQRAERVAAQAAAAARFQQRPGQPTADPASEPGKAETKADAGRWAMFDALAEAQEGAWETAAAAQLAADKAAVLKLAGTTLRAGAKDDDPAASAESVDELLQRLLDDLALEASWRAKVGPLVTSTGRRAVKAVASELGLAFDLLQPGLLEYVEEHGAELVKEIADTTRTAIRDALKAGVEAGESVARLTKRIESSGAFARSRATLIARTETVTVTNGAARSGLSAYAAETPTVTVRKRWLATKDSRTRDAHRQLDGEERGIDEAFSNGRQAPGEPNCRCTCTFALTTTEAEE